MAGKNEGQTTAEGVRVYKNVGLWSQWRMQRDEESAHE